MAAVPICTVSVPFVEIVVSPGALVVIRFAPLVFKARPPGAESKIPLVRVMAPPVEASVIPPDSLKAALDVIAIGPPVVKLKDVGVPPRETGLPPVAVNALAELNVAPRLPVVPSCTESAAFVAIVAGAMPLEPIRFEPEVERVMPPLAAIVLPLASVMAPPVEASVMPPASANVQDALTAIAPPVVRLKKVGLPPMVS